MVKFFKKYHKWLSIVLTLFIVMFALSGIVLNHRNLFSNINVSRKLLPNTYQYKNWNNAAVKGALNYGKDSILIYGNIGVWLTDSLYQSFTDFNNGLPTGINHRKISKIFKHQDKTLFSGTLFGLRQYNDVVKKWENVALPLSHQRVVDIAEKGDTLLVLTRSHLLLTTDYKNFTVKELPKPTDYDNKVGLFKTLWLIHSGEAFGLIGKLIVDLVGIVFIFLTITGLILFINRYKIKAFKKKEKPVQGIKKSSKWNLRWHNKLGWITLILLLMITLTGMFLRPPLLIAIIRSKVNKLPYTLLDNSNPWFDKLRAIKYDTEHQFYIFSTSQGMYFADKNLEKPLQRFKKQPPVSVMGINVFEKESSNNYIIGSFSGIFEWNIVSGRVINKISGKPYIPKAGFGRPVGDEIIAGYIPDYKGNEVCFEYGNGAFLIHQNETFVSMPEKLRNTPMSLWNLALEIHTGRIYQFMFGNFYILFIPLSGLILLFILISGFWVWYKKHRKRKKKNKFYIKEKG